MASKKKTVKKSQEKVATVVVEKTPTIADKQYIYLNHDKMGIEDLASHTGLSVLTINRLINSPELDNMPTDVKKTQLNLRRFYEKEGSVIMTPSQSKLGDQVSSQKDTVIQKRYSQDIQTMKWKHDINPLEQ